MAEEENKTADGSNDGLGALIDEICKHDGADPKDNKTVCINYDDLVRIINKYIS